LDGATDHFGTRGVGQALELFQMIVYVNGVLTAFTGSSDEEGAFRG
jgi:hypothetical protein